MADRVNDTLSSVLNTMREDRLRTILTIAGATTALFSVWIFNDQRKWKSYDTGGSPPNWYGYGRMTVLRVIRLFRGGNLTDHYPLRHDGPKYLQKPIAPRQGPRPTSRKWTLPQRLEPFVEVSPEVHARIFSWTEKFATENPDIVEHRLSATEGYSAHAVYAKPGLTTRNPETTKDKILGGEIFHVHPEEGSLHVWLSESDLKEVVSRKWGERFPMTAIGLLHHPGWGFVYTPRTMAECDVVEEIIRAGIEFVTGQKPKA